MSNFSDEATVSLIFLVSDQPALYDPANTNYRNLKFRIDKWEKIGNNLDKDPEACKNVWGNLKACYDRYQKSSAKRITENVKFFRLMHFLDGVKQQDSKKQQQNEENPQQSIENNLGSGSRKSEPINSGQQYAQVSSVNLSVNVLNSVGTSVPVCENSPLARPKPAPQHQKEIEDGSKSTNTKVTQQKNKENSQKTGTLKKKEMTETNKNKKKSATPKRSSLNTKEDGLDHFLILVRNILGDLPSDLQIKAQTAVFTALNTFKEMALANASTSNATV